MFLAFPAVLPASVSLIERKDGTREASHNVEGAVFGGLGAIAFALTAHAMLTRVAATAALLLAFAVWSAVALATYLVYEMIHRNGLSRRPRSDTSAKAGNDPARAAENRRNGAALG